MLNQVVKVVDPQVDFRPVKLSDHDKLQISDPQHVVLKFLTEESKRQKQEKIRKSAQNWCLI